MACLNYRDKIALSFLTLSKFFYHIQCLIIYCTYSSWSQIDAGIMFGSVLIEKTENRKNPDLVF